jgi:hypothetical protein
MADMSQFEPKINTPVEIPPRLYLRLADEGAKQSPPLSPEALALRLIEDGLARLPHRVTLGVWPPKEQR